jgi:hypothetical protein
MLKNILISTMTPPNTIQTPIIHTFVEFYKVFYAIGVKLPKRDRYGVYACLDRLCIDALQNLITAAFQSKSQKLSTLASVRVQIETAKRLLRLMCELNIFQQKWYVCLENELQEISKMLNGWIRYIER